MQLFAQLKPKWIIMALVILIGIIYWKFPKPPIPCQSLQKYGAIESAGRCVIDRNIELKGKIDRLPHNLTVKGDLIISGTHIEELPPALIITGNLYLYKTSISQLPADIHIGKGFSQDLGWGSPGVNCNAIPKTAIIKGSRRCF